MNNYEKLKIVGRGAHGTVYLCKSLYAKKNVIIKEIPVEMKSQEERQACLGEVKLLALLDHPNIIRYHEHFDDPNNLYIVMEYAEGGTLADYITDRKNCLINESQILNYFAQIVNSLYHLHSKNILHRDLKTQNILLDKSKSICKLSDFGISKILSTRTKASTVIGTPSYLSPEICEGKPYNKKSDVWSLGCILYELTALRKAFEAETLGSLVVQITRGNIKPVDDQYSDDLKQLILSIFSLDPERRPTVNDIRSTAILSNYIYDYCDVGAIVCPKLFKPTKTVKLRSSNRSRKQFNVNTNNNNNNIVEILPVLPIVRTPPPFVGKPKTEHKIFAWGNGFSKITPLPLSSSKVISQIACSLSWKMAVTRDGELLSWKDSENEESSLDSPPSTTWSCKIVTFSSPVQISVVACGEMFYALITDRGILMTAGNGVRGCLGHGAVTDCHQPKIVEDLVGCSIIKVTCGSTHVIASTAENEIFAWGKPDDGRLGILTKEVVLRPKQVELPYPVQIHSLHSSINASAFVTVEGDLWVTGQNGYNKLGLWNNENRSPKIVWEFTKVSCVPKVDVDSDQTFCLGLNHSALISGGNLFTFGCNQDDQLGPRSVGSMDWRPSHVIIQDPVTRVICGDAYCVISTKSKKRRQIFVRQLFIRTDLGSKLLSWGKQRMGKLGRNGNGKDPGVINLEHGTSSSEILSICTSSLDGCTLVCLKCDN